MNFFDLRNFTIFLEYFKYFFMFSTKINKENYNLINISCECIKGSEMK